MPQNTEICSLFTLPKVLHAVVCDMHLHDVGGPCTLHTAPSPPLSPPLQLSTAPRFFVLDNVLPNNGIWTLCLLHQHAQHALLLRNYNKQHTGGGGGGATPRVPRGGRLGPVLVCDTPQPPPPPPSFER